MNAPQLNLPQPFPLSARIGHGYDLHRLQTGGELLLGGVVVSKEMSPIAHSDGDVVLHALVDALLGAMGWGDIGELFPNNDDRWKNARSCLFVTTVYSHVREHHYRVQNADFLILAEKPRLKPFKASIRENIAHLLAVDPGQINIKAGTNEGVDSIGRGEAIAAHATILLVRETSP